MQINEIASHHLFEAEAEAEADSHSFTCSTIEAHGRTQLKHSPDHEASDYFHGLVFQRVRNWRHTS